MRTVIVTTGAELSFLSALEFYEDKLTAAQLSTLYDQVITRVSSLTHAVFHGQMEPEMEHRGQGHRRLIEGHFKIIYRVEGETVYVTDIFDSRQNPEKMKG
jgi:plasmid stabilization system protein ParE